MKQKPTAERVRELFDYDPETGALTNRTQRARAKIGEHAGTQRKDGYWSVSIDCSGRYLAHRVIWLWMTGTWPGRQVDHEDTNRRNNRWVNLREATPTQNNANRKVSRVSKSGIKGANYHPQSGKWRARVQHGGKVTEVGLFETPELAGAAYLAAAQKIHGEFARGTA